ncbi:MAG: CRISPR-associated endonuclease Cas3'', partial [Desulfohalobium sp.]
MEFYAHTKEGQPPSEWQKLDSHIQNVAGLASKAAAYFGAGDWGQVAGLLHDIGKYRSDFQKKLINQSNKYVDHKGVGAKLVWEEWGNPGKLLGYCIAGHHGGLPNFSLSQTDGSTSLQEILDRSGPIPDEALEYVQNV